ncbi:hypothetical protein FDP41_009035 [Naegleria fowleri]|uniref:IQ calmodulin-binding motif family protein n=1 Tax=Naegleria fowleri TaxID=5763 RepID=A0A6A5BDT3_NAEFO|nr:uncharacterized protein FDP41_009035 [Naegleria fowleri]KAF0972786.1 hypothetical protein FDP41_009035 [Naegleria fowleri]CAG4719563.1 unnamed protein product [Naegleria fowleri]
MEVTTSEPTGLVVNYNTLAGRAAMDSLSPTQTRPPIPNSENENPSNNQGLISSFVSSSSSNIPSLSNTIGNELTGSSQNNHNTTTLSKPMKNPSSPQKSPINISASIIEAKQKRPKKPKNVFLKYNLRSSKSKRKYFIRNIEFHPLMAFISAAVEIQRVVKGFLSRRGFYSKRIHELRLAKKLELEEQRREYDKAFENATKALISSNSRKNEDNLRNFMSTYIPILQAKFHQIIAVWKYSNNEALRNRLTHIAATVIQSRYRLYRRRLFEKTGSTQVFFRKYKMYFYDRKSHAAFIIQKWWRNCINKQIFQFYKQLIVFKERSHPYDILKAINPSEAPLLDPAIGAFIRFRLGGSQFPPVIYYKIFMKQPVIDINAFAPRNYASRDVNNISIQPVYFGNHRDLLTKQWDFEDWYQREERNSWRPVATSLLVHEEILLDQQFHVCSNFLLDRVKKEVRQTKNRFSLFPSTTYKVLQAVKSEQEAIDKLLPYHFMPSKRKENLLKKKRKKRLEWLIKLKKVDMIKTQATMNSAPNDEFTAFDDDTPISEDSNVRSAQSDLRILALTMKEKDLLAELEEIELFGDVAHVDDEMDDLLQWCDDLDFYKYTEDWQLLATTLSSNEPRRHNLPQNTHMKVETPEIEKYQQEMLLTQEKLKAHDDTPFIRPSTPSSEYMTITSSEYEEISKTIQAQKDEIQQKAEEISANLQKTIAQSIENKQKMLNELA